MLWVNRFLEGFFSDEGISQMIPYFSNQERLRVSKSLQGIQSCKQGHSEENPMDPISNTLAMTLTRPLALILTEFGVIPFGDRPTVIFPYNIMTHQQVQTIRACLRFNTEWRICNETIVFNRPQIQVFLDPVRLITITCKSIMTAKSPHPKGIRVRLCNIILQRVQSHFPIDQRTQILVNDNIQRWGETLETIQKT